MAINPSGIASSLSGEPPRPPSDKHPHDYRLPRRPNWGLIVLAIVTAAVALPFLGFVIAALIGP